MPLWLLKLGAWKARWHWPGVEAGASQRVGVAEMVQELLATA